MATQFCDKDGRPCALRFSGGSAGVQVKLERGAADVSMTTRLEGDDGSFETLETLAQQVGRGAEWGGEAW
jgi:hypothetical protein